MKGFFLRNPIEISIALVFIAVASSSNAIAQVELDRFFPPAAQIGVSSSFKADGKFPTWPVQVAVDRDDIKIEPGNENGQFVVTVDALAYPGIAWIRVMDSASASTLIPLIIGPAAVVVESEPNDMLSQATAGSLPAAFTGRLQKTGDVDVFKVPMTAGQTLVAHVIGNRVLRSPMDAVLQITDARGNVLFQSDDVRGLDPRIVFSAKTSGDYFLRIFAFPETPNSTIGFAGAANFVYLLEATLGPYLDSVIPLTFRESDTQLHHQVLGWNLTDGDALKSHIDHANGVATLFAANSLGWELVPLVEPGTSILTERDLPSSGIESSSVPAIATIPALFTGVISQPNEVDKFQISAQKDKQYRVLVRSRALGFQVDPALTVSSLDGKKLAENDDISRNDYDSSVTFTAAEDGPILIAIRDITDAFSPSHIYIVSVDESVPDFALTIDADHFVVAAGSTVDIPVSVARLEGMSGDLQIVATDLPSGITSAPVDSLSKGDSSKKVTLKLDASGASALHGSFRISGMLNAETTAVDGSHPHLASHQLRESYALTTFWLTVSPNKEAEAK